MTLQITAVLENGSLTIQGWGWPADGIATIQATDATMYSEYGQAHCDGSGSFWFQCPDPCEAAGPFKVAATNGVPQQGAEYNHEWSNVVELWCNGPAGGTPEPEEPEWPEPEPEPEGTSDDGTDETTEY